MKRKNLSCLRAAVLSCLFGMSNFAWALASISNQDTSQLIAIVLLDSNSNNFVSDFEVTVVLPSGNEIPIQTRNGFFSMQAPEHIGPTDSISLRIAAQVTEDLYATVEFFPYTQKIAINEARNKQIHPPYARTLTFVPLVNASDEASTDYRGKDILPVVAFELPKGNRRAERRQARMERRMVRKNIPIEMQ